MAENGILNSKFSVQLSILIGKYLPPKIGYRIGERLAAFIASNKNWEISKTIRGNQYIVNGEKNTRDELIQKSKQVLTHAGHCYIDLYHFFNKPEKIESLVPFSEPMKEFIEICRTGKGYMVVSPHLSNFDLVVCSLVHHGFKGKVLSYPNPGSGYQLQNEIRASYGLDVLPLGDSRLETKIIQFLKSGGVAATGVDRPVPDRKKRHYVNFFGHPSPLPLGYITTALAANVPIIAVTAIMKPDGTYGFMHSGPIQLKKYKNKLDDIMLNAERILKRIEEYIKLAPDQWLMYYPVWPELVNEKL